MRPDTPVIHEEGREVLKDALTEYAHKETGGTKKVLVYLAHARLEWNALQSRAGMSPGQLSETIEDVRDHVRKRLKAYVAQ